MFLASFLIGLREGLEASLIVGILAAFLKRNGSPLRPLILATIAAIALSIAVGVALNLFSTALPQAQQEALETVIGAVAVVFVTTMILWMNRNARSMKGELEEGAQSALSSGGEKAMAGMAFLAIMKEGFETAVFLLAVFQASTGEGAGLGIVGAALGVGIAVVIGWLIYYGGAKFNLGMFFKVTGPFLILVAAGFVANMFRTAHEAGWVNIGQTQVMDLSWLIQNDSVVGALLTGMFSIQADPRLIEFMAWLAYLIPVMLIYLWPQRWRFSYERVRFTRKLAAGILIAVAVIMFVACPRVDVDVAGATRNVEGSDTVSQVTLVSQTDDTATLRMEGSGEPQEVELQLVSTGELDGAPLMQWEGKVEVTPSADLPTEDISYAELSALNGGRAPSGVNHERNPGPYSAEWSASVTYSARTCGDSLLRASSSSRLLATLSGGGITGTKTVSVSGALDTGGDWQVSDDEVDAAETSIQEAVLASEEAKLWWLWWPIALACIGIGLLAYDAFDGRKVAKRQATAAA